MSSILSETLSSVFESINPYVNEVVAVALFGVGYFLFRSFSFKKAAIPEKAKQTATVTTSLLEAPVVQDLSLSLYQFNVYIRDNLSHKPNVNPFEILHQMQVEGLIPDITSYNTLLDICVEQRNFDTCWKLLAQMKDTLSPVKPDIITFNTLMKGLSLKIEESFNRKREEIESVFQQMESLKADIVESGLTLNEITYNTMIDACVKVNRMKKAFDYFDEMQRLSLKPDVYTYSTLIKGIKNPECITPENNLSRVFGILDKLKEIKLVKTDEILYNCVIDACFKFGDYQKAVKLFNDMVASGVKASAITYGIMIKGYGQYKNIEGALQIYERMTLENIAMNEITLGCLIDACVKCNYLSKGMQILEKEHDKANTIIYTTVLKGYTKEKNLDKAFEIFQRMKANEASKPNIVTLNSLLDCAVQCFNFDKMDSIYKEIIKNSSNENSETADLITYSTYIKGLCRAKRLDEAYQLYQKLKREKVFKLDEVLYNSLLDGLVKIKETERAMEVYNSMLADDISPSNVTYSIMIKLYGNQGKVDEALSIHRQMKREGIRPGLIVYTCLIQTCVKHKRINLIDDLYAEMCENKVVGDPVFYNTLISGLVYNQNLRKGVEILVGTLEKNIRLNDEVYTNILKNLCKIMERKNNYEAPGSFNREDTEINLLKICQLMKKNKIFIEMSLYNQIASYLYKDLGGQSGSPKEYNNSSSYNRRNFNEKPSYSDSKPSYSESNQRMTFNTHLNSEPAAKKPAFQVNSGVDSGRKPVFFNKNRTVPSNI